MCNLLWDAIGISRPGIIACVGAGGKTSLLQSLAAQAVEGKRSVLLTSTTKMFYHQTAGYAQVISQDYAEGAARMAALLAAGQTAAWFCRRDGEKVIGVPPAWLDSIAVQLPALYILAEADGARRCLIKAPSGREPVIPAGTVMTVGILNMNILEQPLTTDNTHRLNMVVERLGKQAGEPVVWQDLAKLASQPQGIFQYARGTKVLLLTGGDGQAAGQAAAQVAGFIKLVNPGIARVVVTAGFGAAMQPREVYCL